jgi:hypothetical protein
MKKITYTISFLDELIFKEKLFFQVQCKPLNVNTDNVIIWLM